MGIGTATREDLAWAAGLFEGEGCFSTNGMPKGKRTAVATINMTDLDVLQRFHAVLGIGRISPEMRNPGRPATKPFWKWSVTGHQDVQAVVAVFWPWLGTRRKARALEVLREARALQAPKKFRSLQRQREQAATA